MLSSYHVRCGECPEPYPGAQDQRVVAIAKAVPLRYGRDAGSGSCFPQPEGEVRLLIESGPAACDGEAEPIQRAIVSVLVGTIDSLMADATSWW